MHSPRPLLPGAAARRCLRRCGRLLVAVALALLLAGPAKAELALEAAVRTALTAPAGGLEPLNAPRWRARLLELYAGRDYAPLWVQGRQLTRPALSLLQEMRAAEERGLRSADYGGNELAYAAIGLAGASGADPAAAGRLDAAFSLAVARFVADLHSGRVDPREVGHDLDVPHAGLDVAAVLGHLAATADTRVALRALEPPFRHYELLKHALARYRLLAMERGVNELPALTASVRPGEHYVGAPQLRRLLHLLGDLPEATEPAAALPHVLDPALVAALRAFQARHGLEADGVLGRATLRELATPLERRVRQIELSLERARWLPPQLPGPPIFVNIPQFRLFAFSTTDDLEASMLQMDVIVGRDFPRSETPVFAADMRYLVLRPYWDVPHGIAVRELLPQIRGDAGWLARNRFEIVRGAGDDARPLPATAENLDALERGSLRLRQLPGPGNALGLVKFMFPNRHSVYLHSTPQQGLFARPRRAFSHGCVRVADPMALILHVLRADPRWTRERIENAMRAGGPTRIDLREPVRVFMIYGTAIATERGNTLFFEDIYGHDARLEARLRARRASGGERG